VAAFSTGDVERLLGVKAHVIRYWEKEIPLIQSQKDLTGKRLYSNRDLQLFLRLKHLLYVRRFTIEGARAELLREVSGENQDLMAAVSALRGELLDLYFTVQRQGERVF